MIATLHFATLVAATIFAAAAALSVDWLLLSVVFVLMRPATARQTMPSSELVHGTQRPTRAFGSRG